MIPGIVAAAGLGDYAAWTPADLGVPPSIWLDWSSPLTQISGRVSSWGDVSGSGIDYGQSNSSRRPAVAAGAPANIRVIDFDDSARALQAAGGLGVARNTSGLWMLVVARRTSVTSGSNNIAWLNNNLGSTTISLRGAGGSGNHAARFRRLGSDAVSEVAALNSSGWHVHILAADFSAGSAIYYADGAALGSTSVTVGSTADADATIPPGLGAWDSQFEGGVFQVAAKLVGRGLLPEADRQRLEGWAAWATGLTDNLPPGHPYKSSPP